MSGVSDQTLFTLIRDFLKIYLPKHRNVSPNTINAYRKSLDQFIDYVKVLKKVPLQDVTFEMIDAKTILAYLDNLEDKCGCGVATRNHKLTALRVFLKYAADRDITVVAVLDELKKVPAKKPYTKQPVAHMSEAATQAILAQPDTSTTKGLRDMFFMVLMYDLGSRCQETIDIKLCNLRFGKQPTVTLRGKGDKERTIPLMQGTVTMLRQYLSVFHKGAALASNAYLFYLVSHGQVHPLSNDCVAKFMKKYAEQARKNCAEVPDNVHPHLFRHSRAMHLYQNGMDLTLVQQWLGHAQLETTQVYAHADTEHKRRAIERATPPDNPLRKVLNPSRFTITDEEQIKVLYGLR